MLSSESGMNEEKGKKNSTHRLTCPLDKEVQVSSFLLQLYPVTNTPALGIHTYKHTHAQTRTHANTPPRGTGTPASTEGLAFSPFCSVSPLCHLLAHLFTPALRKLRGKRHRWCWKRSLMYLHHIRLRHAFSRNAFTEHER